MGMPTSRKDREQAVTHSSADRRAAGAGAPWTAPGGAPSDRAEIADIETPTGKGARDENFPVASWLIARYLRPHVMAFYRFARAADDIADNPALAPAEKVRRLDLFQSALRGGDGPETARRLGQSLEQTGVTPRHAEDLLAAFRQDAVKGRYRDWADLVQYCTLSANPVGRYLMDLHDEGHESWAPSDALCTVLQILNHVQDCQTDYRRMDRVYLPLDWLEAEGLGVEVLDRPASPPEFRRVLDRILGRCADMLETARTRPVRPVSLRLHAETALITALARRLTRRLQREDPLAGRVKLSKWDFAMAGLTGLRALATRRRG